MDGIRQHPVPDDAGETLDLPFTVLEDPEYRQIISGPRVSSGHSHPKAYYGPITIRNYIAGSVKKALRTSKSLVTPCNAIFLDLPVELQLMVLEHLHPIDLYHFSQTSKSLRPVIMNPKAIGVWKTAFARHPDLPKCPPLVSEPKWTFMLFGPGICVGCGKYGALTDFAFREQHCELCMKEKYAQANSLRDTNGNIFPNDHLVTSMVPRSYRYHGLRYTTSYANLGNAKYLRKDFDAMMKKATLIQLLVDHEVPILGALFEEYKEALVTHVKRMEEFSDHANNWANEVFRRCSAENDHALNEVAEKCKKRLLVLGHDSTDIYAVQYSIVQTLRMSQIYRLTCRAFRYIRPKLEELVTNQKVRRLTNERRQLLEARYAEYQKTLAPDSWQYQPPASVIRGIEGFSSFLNADYVTRGDVSSEFANSLFPGFVAEWTKKHQLEILSLFPTTKPEQDFETRLKTLELATSVVTCGDCKFKAQGGRTLLGWKNICRHKRNIVSGHINPCSTYEIYEEVAGAAAASLVSFVGLDPKTATIQDMNARNDGFLCGNCIPGTSNGVTGLKAYTWVECITHSMDMHLLSNPTHSPPLWFLLTPDAARFVREHEYPYPRPIFLIWGCNLCSAHYDERVTRNKAIDHVKEVHMIENPVIGVDVIHDETYFTKRRKQFRLGMDPAYEFKCKRCPDISICKLWEMSNLTTHLRVKHQVVDPVEDEDWTKVQIIAATSPLVITTTDIPA